MVRNEEYAIALLKAALGLLSVQLNSDMVVNVLDQKVKINDHETDGYGLGWGISDFLEDDGDA